ncbi:hypothetical protein EUGRSUZ_L03380 [Eucalyptus grandis]|uniref:Uncharacterized protein n=1 Tax=Eucalyptus grandis TaxID=71139 RepID=A0AAD9T850_EUCGR|nr:hypothetical protein EUGRSUZ_L03380 [Eucalyptus grandis]
MVDILRQIQTIISLHIYSHNDSLTIFYMSHNNELTQPQNSTTFNIVLSLNLITLRKSKIQAKTIFLTKPASAKKELKVAVN